MDDAQKRKALNEDLFRKVNEQIEGLNEAYHHFSGGGDFEIVCECDRLDCEERLPISPDAYTALRADSRTFAVAPGHEDETVENIIEQTRAYWVVQKRAGDPAEIAIALDE
jgi:hypothetical protein